MNRRFLAVLLGTALLVGGVAAVALLEGDLPDLVGDLASGFVGLLRGHGVAGAGVALYLEESGVPMPVPGDVFVMYVGKVAGRTPTTWLIAWLSLLAAVLLGATNLYLISRRWGRQLAYGRVGHAMHLTPARLRRGEDWFARYGAWALIFGRHVPGLRVPITVAAGALRVGYPVFVLSVTASTAAWIAIYLTVGATVGGRLQNFLSLHRTTYYIAPAVAVVLVGYFVYRFVAYRPHNESAPPTSESAGEAGPPAEVAAGEPRAQRRGA
ncbi:MAG: DedA family protein [Candidatus Dormibacterales bacterium]